MDKCLQQEINEFFVPTFDTMNVFFECILQGEVKRTKKHATYSGANVLLARVTIPLHHPDFILTIITTQFMHVSIAVIIIIIILVAVPAHAAGTLTVEEAEVSAAGSSQELRQLSRLGPYRQRKETGMN